MDILQKQGWLAIKGKQIELINKYPEIIDCCADVKRFLATCNDLRGDELIKSVYRAHPYYAINSRIAHAFVDERRVDKNKK